mgnify:CR=1 FL=1
MISKLQEFFENPSNFGWLLIFDNVEEYQSLQEIIPKKGGSILIISNSRPPLNEITSILEIQKFERKVSIQYLEKILGTTQLGSSEYKLAKCLEDIPLNLSLATSCIREMSMNIETYLKLFNEEIKQLNASIYENIGKEEASTFITVKIILEKLRFEVPFAFKILSQISFLNSRSYSFFSFRNCLKQLLSNEQEAELDVRFESLIEKLSLLSLIQVNPVEQIIQVPLIFQSMIRSLTSPKLRVELISSNIQLLGELFRNVQHGLPGYAQNSKVYEFILSSLSLAQFMKENDQFCPEIEKLLLQAGILSIDHSFIFIAISCFEISIAFQSKNGAQDKFLLLKTLSHLGNCYSQLQEFSKACEAYEAFVQNYHGFSGASLFELALACENLGGCYMKIENKELSKSYFLKSLECYEKFFEFDGTQLSLTLETLGNKLYSLNQLEISMYCFEKVLSIKKLRHGESHLEVMITLEKLGNIDFELEHYLQAFDRFSKVLKIQENCYGKTDPRLSTILVFLGKTSNELGSFQQSIQYLKRAKSLEAKQYGKLDIRLLPTLKYLAHTYLQFEEEKKAKKIFEKVLTISEQNPNQDQIFDSLYHLALINHEEGNLNLAKKQFERAYELKNSMTPTQDWILGKILEHLGRVHFELENIPEAKELFQQSLTLAQKILKEDDFDFITIFENLGYFYQEIGEPEQASTYFEKELILEEVLYGGNHVQIAITLSNLGLTQLERSNYKKAKDIFQRSIQIFHEHEKGYQLDIFFTLIYLADSLNKLEEPLQAFDCYKRAVQIYQEHFSDVAYLEPYLARVLANNYLSSNKFNEGIQLFQRTITNFETHFGPNHLEIGHTLRDLASGYQRLNQIELSKKYLEEALAILTSNYHNQNHPTLINIRHELRTFF